MRKENWTYKKLGEVCDSELGKTLNSSKDKGELRPYLCAVNVLWDKFDLSILKETRFEEDELDRYSVKKGDLLVCEGGDVGRAAIWNDETVIQYQNALHRIRFKGDVIPRFCLFYLRHLKDNGTLDAKDAKGVTIKHLVKSSLLSIPIPIPPIKEQEEICSLLDKLSLVIEKKKQQVKELDNLAQAIFYDMFGDPVENEKGWEVKKMGDVAPAVEYKGKHPQIANKYWLLNLDKVEAQTGRILSIDYYDYEEIGNSVVSFDKTNVLYSKLRPYLNKVVVPTQIGYVTSELVPLQPNASLLDRQYIAYMLRSKLFVDYISGKVAGAKMPRVTMSVFRDFKVPIPPLSLQQSFAQKIESIERQKELINQSIREAQTLFDSRMEYYFGE